MKKINLRIYCHQCYKDNKSVLKPTLKQAGELAGLLVERDTSVHEVIGSNPDNCQYIFKDKAANI